jgi:5-(carboxyamino)imidazole ribonucleotide synthase
MTASPATNRDAAPILPGAMLGVLGSGQLGKMFAMAAARLGYRVHVYAPEHDAPAADVAYRQTIGGVRRRSGRRRVRSLGRRGNSGVREHLRRRDRSRGPASPPCGPAGRVLHTTQQRLREKGFLKAAGIPCTPFAEATTKDQLAAALAELGTPAVLKTAALGLRRQGAVDRPLGRRSRSGPRPPRRSAGDPRRLGRFRMRSLDARRPQRAGRGGVLRADC